MTSRPHPAPGLDQDAVVYVAGHRGLAGGAIWRELEAQGHRRLVGRSSEELDLRDREAVYAFFAAQRPTYVVLAAAKVGGIMANSTYPADFISDNLRIQVNVLDAAAAHGAERLLFLGSSCIYPKLAEQPISEDSLLTGRLEPTNAAYAIAKIAGIAHVQALRQQFQRSFISAMPTNLYGPGDNFALDNSHVLPALIRRFHEAKVEGHSEVVVWGTGAPRREFLHVEDLARAAVFLLQHYDHPDPINIGIGTDVTIRELAELIADIVGFDGELRWDTSKPDGTPRKLLDVSRLAKLGWQPQIDLTTGIKATYAWYADNVAAARV